EVGAAAADAVNVSVSISDAGGLKLSLPRRIGPPLQLRFTLTVLQGGGGLRRVMPIAWTPTVNAAAAPVAAFGARADDPTLKREVELTLPKGRVQAVAAPAQPASMILFGAGRWPKGMPTLGEVCEALHQVPADGGARLEFVADSFVRDRITASAVAGRHPLVQILDAVAKELEYDWVKAGNLIRFRS